MKVDTYKRHESMRGYFSFSLYHEMLVNENVWLVTADLGYKMFNPHFEDFPDRCINTGAAEQAAVDIGIGLALEGKIPIVYSITPFLLRRAYEGIKLYVNDEKIPVKLVGSGRDKGYLADGRSHWAEDAKDILGNMPNIKPYWPETKEEMKGLVFEIINNCRPCFVSLKRAE